ncbi:MAG: hypothetical protein ACI30A_00235 [Paludibacteraceae bacterium]
MKQITTFFCVLAIGMLLCSTPARAQEEEFDPAEIPGLTCGNPIPLTEDLAMELPVAWSYWFSAWTYDLPVHARFTPSDPWAEAPTVSVYFSCNGEYDDPKLEEMIKAADGWGVKVPIDFTFDKYAKDDGTVYYDLEISESYRGLMMQWGLTYDVQALVNLTVDTYGDVELVPDSIFRNCAENAHWVNWPDTLHISQAKLDTTYIFPVTEWRNDSIRLRWTGKEQKAVIYMGSTCDFELTGADPDVLDIIVLDTETSGNNYRDFSSQALNEMIEKWGEGGLYYVRIVTTEEADLIVEPKPIEGALADAVMLYYDIPQPVAAEDTAQYYFFRKTWDRQPLLLEATGARDTIIAYIGTTPDFYISAADPHYLGELRFEPTDRNRQQLALSAYELQQYTQKCEMDFLFIRFLTTRDAVITPRVWQVGSCAANSLELLPNDRKSQPKQYTHRVYRMNYEKWMRGDVEFYWNGIEPVYIYLADTCSFGLYQSDPHVLYYQKQPEQTSLLLDTVTLHSFADRVDADGYLYFRFNNPTAGTLITTQNYVAPEQPNESIALLLGEATAVATAADNQYYYFPAAWQSMSIDFAADRTDTVRMYVGSQEAFDLAGKDGNLIGSYLFYPEQGGSHLRLSAYQLAQLAAQTTAENLYVFFATDEEITVTPTVWNISGCGADTDELLPIDRQTLVANTPAMYRINYAKWAKQDVTFAWTGSEVAHIFLGDTCQFPTVGSNRHVLDHQTLASGNTTVYTTAMLKLAKSSQDENGFLYVQLYSIGTGELTTSIAELPDVPTAIANTNEDLQVRYANGQPILSVSTAQQLCLYNYLGTLVATWQQLPGETHAIDAADGNIYILRGASGSVLIRK